MIDMKCFRFVMLARLGLIGLLAPSLAWATPYYVAPGGDDSHSGLNWAQAFATISNAVAQSDAGRVILASGTYTLAEQVTVSKGITITGFYGVAQTVVNGAGLTRCFFLAHSNAVLANLTISNGCVTHSADSNGGGVYLAGTNAAIYNCLVGWCHATNGGGIYAVTNALISGCTVIRNVATNTAGIYARGSSRVLDCFIISNTATYTSGGLSLDNSMATNCTISYNYKLGAADNASGAGVFMTGARSKLYNSTIATNLNTGGTGAGGVRVSGGIIQNCVISNNWNNDGFHNACGLYLYGAVTGINCTIVGNYGQMGGGVQLAYGMAVLRDSVISNNVSVGYAGGVYFWQGTLLNCTIVNNIGTGTAGGGVVLMNTGGTHGPFYMSNCIIRANSSQRAGAGIVVLPNPGGDGYVRNCLITENVSATNGGGVSLEGIGEMSSCTIASNYAWRGGGVAWRGTNAMVITNCIIYGNAIGDAGNTTNIDLFDASAPTNAHGLAFCCTSDTNYYGGAGSVMADPQFRDIAMKDFRLWDGSPCRNAGTNQPWMLSAVDLLGTPRIKPSGGIVDMGAYEYLPLITIFTGR